MPCGGSESLCWPSHFGANDPVVRAPPSRKHHQSCDQQCDTATSQSLQEPFALPSNPSGLTLLTPPGCDHQMSTATTEISHNADTFASATTVPVATIRPSVLMQRHPSARGSSA
jgi:hypothetical protein